MSDPELARESLSQILEATSRIERSAGGIVDDRDQVHAHSDITVMEAKVSVHEYMGQRYSQVGGNFITGGEEFSKLKNIIALIEATLDNMYVHEKQLEAKLEIE